MMKLPENTRIWIYIANEKINGDKRLYLENQFENFLSDWSAHGHGLSSYLKIWDDSVLIIGVDEKNYGASGCSVDKLTRFLQTIEKEMQMVLLDRMQCAAWDGKQIILFKAKDFSKKIESGELNAECEIINTQISSSNQWNGEALIKAKDSWLRNYLPKTVN